MNPCPISRRNLPFVPNSYSREPPCVKVPRPPRSGLSDDQCAYRRKCLPSNWSRPRPPRPIICDGIFNRFDNESIRDLRNALRRAVQPVRRITLIYSHSSFICPSFASSASTGSFCTRHPVDFRHE